MRDVVDIRFSYVTRPFNFISSAKSGERACHERRMVRGLHSLISREISDARRSFYGANQSRAHLLMSIEEIDIIGVRSIAINKSDQQLV